MGLMLHPSLPGCAGGPETLQAKPHSSHTGILRWFFLKFRLPLSIRLFGD